MQAPEHPIQRHIRKRLAGVQQDIDNANLVIDGFITTKQNNKANEFERDTALQHDDAALILAWRRYLSDPNINRIWLRRINYMIITIKHGLT